MSGGLLDVTLPELSVGPSVAGIDGSAGTATIPALAQAAASGQVGPITDQQALIDTAGRIGVNPRDLATVISYETGGKFSPSIMGGAGGRYGGLIQFGPKEREAYGASMDQTFQEQLPAVERYLTGRGFKPGMGILDLYSTINAGRPGLYNRSDAGNGGAPGTVADKVNNQFGPHYTNADKFLAGTSYAGGATPAAPSMNSGTTLGAANPGMSAGSTAGQGGFGLAGIQAQGGPIAGQSAPAGVASLVDQPMTAMGPTAQSMMPGTGQGGAAAQSPYGGIASALQGIGGGQGQGQGQKAPGMQNPQAPRLNPIGLQQARQLFDANRFYTMLKGQR